MNVPLGGAEASSNLHAQAYSLVVGVSMTGRIHVWVVDASQSEAYTAPASYKVNSPPYTGPATCAAAVPPLRQHPGLPVVIVGYADGSVRLFVLTMDMATIVDHVNQYAKLTRGATPPPFEPLRRWARVELGTHPVIRVAMESPLRVAVVTRDAWDVAQIFESESSLTGPSWLS